MWHVACGTCRSALRPKGKIAGITRARRLDREALEDILLKGRFAMALDLENMGTLVVHIDATWNFAGGPIAGRSCSAFREIIWTGPWLKARSVWGHGSYQNGAEIAEANIRALFHTDDATQIYLDYIVRAHLPSHLRGETPAIMSGRLEVEETNKKYAWLNRTQIVGYGILDLDAKTQTYEVHVLRWQADSGPQLTIP
jgi:hypothetical protein